MAKTPLSSATAYATAADCLDAHDERAWGDSLLDSNQRQFSITNDPRLAKALKRASGMIEAACLTAGKYTPADLNAMTGVSKDLLTGIVVELAFWICECRRKPNAEPMPMTRWALQHLERLRLGEMIFGFEETADAGNPQTSFVQQSNIDTLDLVSSQTKRFFGIRGKENRLGRN